MLRTRTQKKRFASLSWTKERVNRVNERKVLDWRKKRVQQEQKQRRKKCSLLFLSDLSPLSVPTKKEQNCCDCVCSFPGSKFDSIRFHSLFSFWSSGSLTVCVEGEEEARRRSDFWHRRLTEHTHSQAVGAAGIAFSSPPSLFWLYIFTAESPALIWGNGSHYVTHHTYKRGREQEFHSRCKSWCCTGQYLLTVWWVKLNDEIHQI